jgi:uncharacterized protein YbcI
MDSEITRPSDQQRGDERADISTAMVRLYKERFGRGPTNAVTHFAGPDCIVSTLENTFTVAERHLVASGEHQRLMDTRQSVKTAAETAFRTTIEEITGRNVRSYITGTDTHNDISVEVFYLEPNISD